MNPPSKQEAIAEMIWDERPLINATWAELKVWAKKSEVGYYLLRYRHLAQKILNYLEGKYDRPNLS